MCLILLAYHPEHPLVLAANRDEFYARPSAAAHFWDDAPHILAGQDLQAGGTWLGVDRCGRFAALSNYRDPRSERVDARSRGLIVSDFLRGCQSPPEYLSELHAQRERYNGFNLLLGDARAVYYYASRAGEARVLAGGIYGLSNAFLDTPWPKVERGKSALRGLLSATDPIDFEAMFRVLGDRSLPSDAQLPHTGVDRETERMLAPLFISSPHYGTRCSTILLIDPQGQVTLLERLFDGQTAPRHTVRHEFRIEGR